MAVLKLESPYVRAGDQSQTIEKLVAGFESGKSIQVLLEATGTGKTFTASNVIARLGKPTLVLAHNQSRAVRRGL